MSFFDTTPHQLLSSVLGSSAFFAQWHFFFEPDISAQMLIWEHTIIQRLLYCFFIAKTHFFSQLRWFCNTFETKPTNQNFYQTWGITKPKTWKPTNPEILRYYVVKASYIFEVIRTKFKNNQAKRKRYNSSLIIVNWCTISNMYKHKFCFPHSDQVWNSEQNYYGIWLEETL